MAQGDQRPRHSRQSSRIFRLGSSDDTGAWGKTSSNTIRPSDNATINYIKRVLCSNSPRLGSPIDSAQGDDDPRTLEELVPPLTSSNAVDLQLYVIIAVILNQFVQSWYNRITPDQDFVAEVVQIIAHCTRGLEQRLRLIDLEELLLDELPAILVDHVEGIV